MAGRKSEAQRDRAALLVATGYTVKAAAKKAGIARRTLTGWMTEPAFQTRVRDFRGRLLTATVGGLSRAGGKAVRTLEKHLDDPKAEVQAGAANKILTHLFRGVDLVDIAERVAAIEAIEARRAGAAKGAGDE